MEAVDLITQIAWQENHIYVVYEIFGADCLFWRKFLAITIEAIFFASLDL